MYRSRSLTHTHISLSHTCFAFQISCDRFFGVRGCCRLARSLTRTHAPTTTNSLPCCANAGASEPAAGRSAAKKPKETTTESEWRAHCLLVMSHHPPATSRFSIALSFTLATSTPYTHTTLRANVSSDLLSRCHHLPCLAGSETGIVLVVVSPPLLHHPLIPFISVGHLTAQHHHRRRRLRTRSRAPGDAP